MIRIRVLMKPSATTADVARLKADLETLLGHPLPLVQLPSSSASGSENKQVGQSELQQRFGTRRDSCHNRIILDLTMAERNEMAIQLVKNHSLVDTFKEMETVQKSEPA